jgi:hypothetical protein
MGIDVVQLHLLCVSLFKLSVESRREEWEVVTDKRPVNNKLMGYSEETER